MSRLFDQHSALLTDVLTERAAFNGERYPRDWATVDLEEDEPVKDFPVGDTVAAWYGKRVHVCRVERFFHGRQQLEMGVLRGFASGRGPDGPGTRSSTTSPPR